MPNFPFLPPTCDLLADAPEPTSTGDDAVLVVRDPATGEVLAQLPRQGAADARSAVTMAERAMRDARPAPGPEERAGWLQKIAAGLQAERANFALLITREQGKPLAESLNEVDYATRFFEVAASHLDSLAEMPHPLPIRGQTWRTIHRPAGVAALIAPWNFPLAMLAKKLPSALAAGCATILKPAEETPLSALALARLCRTAGVPPGWVQVLHGDAPAIGRVLCEAPAVRVLSFTGSTEVGRLLARQCADHVKRLTLELGGNAPFIVFADADLDAAVAGFMASKFRCAGQTCVCANRLYVQAGVADEFAARLATRMARLKVGVGTAPDTDLGPLIGRRAFAKVERHVRESIRLGARLRLGGDATTPVEEWGCFYPPTLLDGVTDAMPVSREETFGPVVGLARFVDEAEVVRRANGTPYGLAAYVYTQDMALARRVVEGLEFGYVAVNSGGGPVADLPFGGMKQSGYGREGGAEGLLEFSEVQTVAGLE